MTSENVARARRWFEEVWNQRRAEAIDEFLTPESVCHSETGELRGVDGFKERMYFPLLGAFPDFRIEVQETVAEGDYVVNRWKVTATHTGEGFGLPPTGRPISVQGMTCVRFQDGKMLEGWDHWNAGGLFQSLRSDDSPASPASS